MISKILIAACALLLISHLVLAVPYLEDGLNSLHNRTGESDETRGYTIQLLKEMPEDDAVEDYSADNLERLLQNTQKRSCIRRFGRCDHRPNDCCYNSSCRCNLWGSNCRCQRMGLFQKWG
uniref:Xibalbin-1 n=1 Tax=Xibalbanus tulumensis TaxID=1519145 RepID=XIB1_XIBTU